MRCAGVPGNYNETRWRPIPHNLVPYGEFQQVIGLQRLIVKEARGFKSGCLKGANQPVKIEAEESASLW